MELGLVVGVQLGLKVEAFFQKHPPPLDALIVRCRANEKGFDLHANRFYAMFRRLAFGYCHAHELIQLGIGAPRASTVRSYREGDLPCLRPKYVPQLNAKSLI